MHIILSPLPVIQTTYRHFKPCIIDQVFLADRAIIILATTHILDFGTIQQ